MIARNAFRQIKSRDLHVLSPRLMEAGLFTAETQLVDYARQYPWGVQLDAKRPEETHAVLDVWREGSGLGIIRLFKARPRDERSFLAHLVDVLNDEGFAAALSPGLMATAKRPFKKAGFEECERLVVLKKQSMLFRRQGAACEIELMTHLDAPRVVDIDETCFDDLWRFRRGDVGRMLPNVTGFLAVQNGTAIGYTMVSTCLGAGTVGRLAVRPEHRNKGVGSTLLAAGLDWLREAGSGEVTLCTQRDNASSRRLYRRFGFEQLPDELWIMRKDL